MHTCDCSHEHKYNTRTKQDQNYEVVISYLPVASARIAVIGSLSL